MKFATIGRRRKRVETGAAAPGPLEIALGPALDDGRWHVPDRFNFTRDVVETLAADPKRHALTVLGHDGVIEYRTFRQIAEGTARWAVQLRERDVEPGDRLLVLVGKTLDWLEIMLAGIKVGAVLIPCPEALPAAAIAIRVSSSDAKLVVASRSSEMEIDQLSEPPPVLYVDEALAAADPKLTEAPTHDTSAKDPAFVLSTSGVVTGPKGVLHTHAATYAARVHAEYWLDAGPRDSVWCTADTGSAQAIWSVLLGPWSRGAGIVLHEGPFDPADRLDLVSRLGTTVLCQTPAEYRALAEMGERQLRRYRPPRLRRLVSTGDHLSPDVVTAFEEAWELTILDGYGQAEVGIVAGNGIGAGARAGSLGLPLPGYEVAVIDEQGSEVVVGATGDIAVRGRPASLFSGYWDAPDETKAAFRGDWLVTGDVGWADEDGFLWFAGREHDIITSGGERFGPVEIEEALTAHGAVLDAAAVGARDLALGGQYVRAFVVLKPGTEKSDRLVAELRESARLVIPDHKVPREIEFLDALPTTPNGKIRRLELQDRPAVSPEPFRPPAPPPPLTPEPEPETEVRAEVGIHELAATVPERDPDPLAELVCESAVEPVPDEAPEPAEPEAIVEQPAAEAGADDVVYAPPEGEAAGVVDEVLFADADPGPASEEVMFAHSEPESALPPDPLGELGEEPDLEPSVEETAAPLPEPVAQEVVWTRPEPAAAEPDPLADLIREPAPDPEPPVIEEVAQVEPAPESVSDPLADLIRGPATDLPPPEPAPSALEPEAEPVGPDPLADLILSPETEAPADAEDVSLADLGLPPVTEFPRDTGRERGDSGRRGRSSRAAPANDRKAKQRSSLEPGDELEEVDWMQGLSSRLSAYSLAGEDDKPEESEPEPDNADSA